MTPVYQTIRTMPDEALILGTPPGNCFQACVASIFELPIDAVPHFFADGRAHEPISQSQWDRIREFARTHNRTALYISMPEEPELRDRLYAAEIDYIAFGPSPRGDFGHCVVGRGRIFTHDPVGPDGKFLAGDPWLYMLFLETQPSEPDQVD